MPAPPPRDDLPRNRRTAAFERTVAGRLEELGVHGPVVVAVSGGPDSMATLVALARSLGPVVVTAGHFDHRLRSPGEAVREREAVATLAQRLGIAFKDGRAPFRPRDRSESAAREARYRWLEQACREAGATTLVTGHTVNDQAETVILQLTRGAGALGAAGMRPLAPWPVGLRGADRLWVARPLLWHTRDEVEAYLRALGVEATLDPTNETAEYARNRVRHVVLPALTEVNTRVTEHLADFAAWQRQDEELLAALAVEWLDTHAQTAQECVELDRRALRAAPPAIASRAVREAAWRLGVDLEGAHIRAILRSAGRKGTSVDLPLARSETGATILRLRTRSSPPVTDQS